MTSQTITIPAREVLPGDVLFGMTIERSAETNVTRPSAWFLKSSGFAMNIEPDAEVTVERPVPSDPACTVRAQVVDDVAVRVFWKQARNTWTENGTTVTLDDSDVADFPILWKPGMPIPTEGVQA